MRKADRSGVAGCCGLNSNAALSSKLWIDFTKLLRVGWRLALDDGSSKIPMAGAGCVSIACLTFHGVDMPFIKPDEGAFEDDETGETINSDSFQYCPVEMIAYEPRPFDPDALTGATAVVYGLLRSSGLTEFHVRYDGGHDEGLAHADGGRTKDGSYRPIDAIASQLATAKNVDELRVAFMQPQGPVPRDSADQYYGKMAPVDFVKHMLDDLACEMANCLFGEGYGTGEYSMYGEFTADLTDGTLTDNEGAVQPPDVSFD